MTTTAKILVTSALPYANGSIHLGHLVEVIQADIWVRFQKMQGRSCIYVCADDTHGTPIMLAAQKQGISPEALIDKVHQEHQQDFQAFAIGFDHYYTTHSEENRELSRFIYQRLKQAGYITTRAVEQAYDSVKQMFLPDRFIKGECPVCGEADQYGDNCEKCHKSYDASELKNPISVVSGTRPIKKSSEHYFFKLPEFTQMLQQWTTQGHLQEEISSKLKEWFEAGLQEWDISRDAPYFGFEIPEAKDKYFYVWLDAPIGYMASFKNYCQQQGLDFDEYWQADSKTELYHFIGKDIVYFHALFWPAMLAGAGFRTPTAIFTHGFLTIDGKKMSKSKGTFIKASTYLKHLAPEYLRYYFACKLNASISDIDLNLDDFSQRVNSDLVGKVINIASRSSSFLKRQFHHQLAQQLPNNDLYAEFVKASTSIAEAYQQREYSQAMREIMHLADQANQYIAEQKPWLMAKNPNQTDALHQVCTLAINLFMVLIVYLKPVLPLLAEKVEALLNIATMTWQTIETPLLNHTINAFQPLMPRVDTKQIQAIQQDSVQDLQVKS